MQRGEDRVSIDMTSDLRLGLSDDGGVCVHHLRAFGQVLQLARDIAGQGESLGRGGVSQGTVYVIGDVSDLDHSGHDRTIPSVGAHCTHVRHGHYQRSWLAQQCAVAGAQALVM